MKLTNRYREAVITETFVFEDGDETFILKEYLNEDNNVIDSQVLDQTGISLNDPALLEHLQELADKGL